MGKVRVKILDLNKFGKLTGNRSREDIVKIDAKEAAVLIKQGVVELSELQREMEGTKEETIILNQEPAVIEFLKNPNLLEKLVVEVQKSVVGEENAIKSILVACMLNKVENKQGTSANLCINAQSGAGKDYLTSEVLKLFPEQFVFARRRITPAVLDYALAKHQGRDWNNFFIYLEDVGNKVLNAESIKTLLSANPQKTNIVSIVYEGAVRDLKIKGKPFFLVTSAKIRAKEETLRRLPFLYLDESPEHTLEINRRQAKQASLGLIEEMEELPKQFYLGLEKVKVVIPFAEEIALKLGGLWVKRSKRYQIVQRTIFPRFLDYIKASASLYQYQRKKTKEGYVTAEAPLDYDNARTVLLQTTSNALMLPLGRDEKELIQSVNEHFPSGGSVKDINLKFSKWEERWLRNNLDKLTDLGFLKKDKIDAPNSDKAIAIYLPCPDILNFSIPTWKELNSKNNAIGASGAKGASNANSAKGMKNIPIAPIVPNTNPKKTKNLEKMNKKCFTCGGPAVAGCEADGNWYCSGCYPSKIEQDLV